MLLVGFLFCRDKMGGLVWASDCDNFEKKRKQKLIDSVIKHFNGLWPFPTYDKIYKSQNGEYFPAWSWQFSAQVCTRLEFESRKTELATDECKCDNKTPPTKE
jgi:hypothetical protein